MANDPIELPDGLPTVSIGICIEFARGKKKFDQTVYRSALTVIGFLGEKTKLIPPAPMQADPAPLTLEGGADLLESALVSQSGDGAGGPLVGILASLAIDWAIKFILEKLKSEPQVI
jgi:hypothetical protein